MVEVSDATTERYSLLVRAYPGSLCRFQLLADLLLYVPGESFSGPLLAQGRKPAM